MGYATGPDAVLTYKIGTWDGGSVEFPSGAGTSLQCLIKNFNPSGAVADIDTTALCDTESIGQPGLGSGTITFDAMVPIGGSVFEKGQALYFTVKSDTSVSVAIPYAGYVSNAGLRFEVGGLTMQSITVRVGIDFTTAS